MIYPKDFSCVNVEVKQNSAFVVMPFEEAFDPVYAAIKRACIDEDIVCSRADDVFASGPIIEKILNELTTTEIIIADLTEKNPNVYYEIGIAHSLRERDSIILITQSIEDVPFDIKHWSILIYDTRNMVEFRTELKKRLQHSRKASRRRVYFKNFFRSQGVGGELIELFIEKAEMLSEKKTEVVYQILNSRFEPNDQDKIEIEGLLNYLQQLEELQAGKIKKPAQILKLNVFLSDLILTEYSGLAKDLLVRSRQDLIHVDDLETFSFVADFCFGLIKKEVLKENAINWLVQYLHNYRMGRIDIVRSKIDVFFLNSDDSDINATLLTMLKSSVLYVRETAADISGQKNLREAIPKLIETLKHEENAHVARSCITALTKMQAKEAAEVIYNWMKNNTEKWGDKAVSASLKHIALSSLKELDDEGAYYKWLDELANGEK